MKLKSEKKAKSPSKFFENSVDVWLSSSEAAKFFSTTPNAIRIMVCRGILTAHRLRGRLRFSLRDCQALIQKNGA